MDDLTEEANPHFIHSTLRERIVEHVFVGEALRRLWQMGVTDVEVLNGSLQATVAWSASERAKKELKVGAAVTIVPDGGKAFAGAVCSVQGVDSRQRVQFVINSRVAARLAPGQSLRIFLPGTGPAVPEGRAGVPQPKK